MDGAKGFCGGEEVALEGPKGLWGPKDAVSEGPQGSQLGQRATLGGSWEGRGAAADGSKGP